MTIEKKVTPPYPDRPGFFPKKGKNMGFGDFAFSF